MNYQKYTWYNHMSKLDNPETIHQVMSYGEIDEIKEMENAIGHVKIKQAFLEHPKKVYSKPVFYFIKNYIIKNEELLDERKYLKNTPRYSR